MKRAIAAVLLAGMLGAATPGLAATMPVQDTMFDRMGDWFATFGKSGLEKESVLAQRHADRTAKRANEAAQQNAEQAERSLKKAGRDLDNRTERAGDNLEGAGKDLGRGIRNATGQ